MVIEAIYDITHDFSEGLAGVWNGDRYGYIDKTGILVIPFEYKTIFPFSEGLAVVQGEELRYGVIDKNNEIIIPLQYNAIESFSEGFAA
jgi:hypothetical protein